MLTFFSRNNTPHRHYSPPSRVSYSHALHCAGVLDLGFVRRVFPVVEAGSPAGDFGASCGVDRRVHAHLDCRDEGDPGAAGGGSSYVVEYWRGVDNYCGELAVVCDCGELGARVRCGVRLFY